MNQLRVCNGKMQWTRGTSTISQVSQEISESVTSEANSSVKMPMISVRSSPLNFLAFSFSGLSWLHY